MNIFSLLDEYCYLSKNLRGVSPETIRRYKENIGLFCRFNNIEQPEEITKKKVLRFFTHGGAERNWGPATFHTYHMSLRVFFTWLYQNNRITETFVEDIMLPRIPRSLPKALSEEDTQKLLSVTYNYPWSSEFERARNYAIISTYVFTGVRRSELLNLTEHDLNFEQATLRVNRGKWNKDRVIPMSKPLMEALYVYLEHKRKYQYKNPHVFCSARQDQALKKGGLKGMMAKLKNASGLKIGNHIMRHTFAILMLQGGCDIVSLSRMLGHSDVKTTMKYLLIHDEQLKMQMYKHPLNNTKDGTIRRKQIGSYSLNAQRSQENQIFRQDQFSKPESNLRYSKPAGLPVFNGDNWGNRNR